MTERLYYDNAYLTEFDAHVTECVSAEDGLFALRLDKSAFYPTSGGQPHDTGCINDAQVTDVEVDKLGDVVHTVDKFIEPGTLVHCRIDWARRFDHMQQHAGEHTLAGCVYRMFGGHTIGLHLGHDDSSIDVELPDGRMRLTDEELDAIEDDVNAHIQADVPIKCWFPEPDELASLPLRKPPTVKEHVRIVQIGDDEFCACGGTHPSSAGQIGLFKILDARPSRGKIRFTFVCGKRAFDYLRSCMKALHQVETLVSASNADVVSTVQALKDRLRETQYELGFERRQSALLKLDELTSRAPVINGNTVVSYVFNGLDADSLKDAAAALIAAPSRIALLGSKQTDQSLLLIFAHSEDVTADMNALIRACGAKGGGKSDFARGSAQSETVLETALTLLRS